MLDVVEDWYFLFCHVLCVSSVFLWFWKKNKLLQTFALR